MEGKIADFELNQTLFESIQTINKTEFNETMNDTEFREIYMTPVTSFITFTVDFFGFSSSVGSFIFLIWFLKLNPLLKWTLVSQSVLMILFFISMFFGHLWMLVGDFQGIITCSMIMTPVVLGVFTTMNTSVVISSLRFV